MELSYYGANCIMLTTKLAKVLFDPEVYNLNLPLKKADIEVHTHKQDRAFKDALLLDTPGEYEAKEVSLKGIRTRGHMDEESSATTTMFRVDAAGIRIGLLGHVHPDLSNEQLENLGTLDILIIPVGGHGYTLDAESASRIVRAIEPKVVIPTHFADKGIKYEVPQAELKEFIDELGAPTQEESKYKIKAGAFPEQLTVVILERSA